MKVNNISSWSSFPRGESVVRRGSYVINNRETADTFIKNNSAVSFGYKFRLKTLWLKGKLPWLQYGFYGDKLTRKNVSIEHLEPVSVFKKKMGTKAAEKASTVWNNVVLASIQKNQERSNYPLGKYINEEARQKYLDQFRGKIIPGYGRGEKYIKAINETIERLLREGK